MEQHKYRFWKNLGHCLMAGVAIVALAGCGGDSPSSGASTPSGGSTPPGTDQNQAQPSPTPPPGSNSPPTILGIPPVSATAGQDYSFQPSVSDPNGDSLTFSIVNQPAWTTFNATTGHLTGTPTVADVGTYENIIIRVSDGTTSTALVAFSITATQISTGSATISWLPPTQNTDGSALTDLAGFRIYYGTSATTLTQVATITNPGLTSYVVQNLAAATWYFTVRAYAADGAESTSSNIASKTIQ